MKSSKLKIQSSKFRAGFTLLELLVVLSVIAMLIGVVFPNFLGARERARDQKRKSEATELKKALQLYYADYKTYPPSSGGLLKGCGSTGLLQCPVCGSSEFAAGNADGCKTTYMRALPKIGQVLSYTYYQCAGGEDYRIITTLENLSDPDIAASQTRCPFGCGVPGTSYTSGQYVMCAD